MSKTVSKFALAASVSFAMAFTFSCSPPDDGGGNPSSSSGGGGGYTGSYGSITYEGQTYKTVKIGEQTWLAENLNYVAKGSKCYGEVQANCNKYGRLYDWSTAMDLPSNCNKSECSDQIQSNHQGICLSGWHIPSNEDWDKLYRYADGTSDTRRSTAGRYLKATSGWDYNGNGTDEFGFSALPGGSGYADDSGTFYDGGYAGYWWSASETTDETAYLRGIFCCEDDGSDAGWKPNRKSALYSVRCLQD